MSYHQFSDNKPRKWAIWIAYAGCQRLKAGQKDGDEIIIYSRWPMDELPAV